MQGKNPQFTPDVLSMPVALAVVKPQKNMFAIRPHCKICTVKLFHWKSCFSQPVVGYCCRGLSDFHFGLYSSSSRATGQSADNFQA